MTACDTWKILIPVVFTWQSGAKLEKFLERIFTRWGTFCARWPKTVLLVGIVIGVALACGISMFEVITNPVLLWSSPNSRARLEKDYFDSHFRWGISSCSHKGVKYHHTSIEIYCETVIDRTNKQYKRVHSFMSVRVRQRSEISV